MLRTALFVGINDYSEDTLFPPLRYAVDDATEMASLLAMPEYGFVAKTVINSAAMRRQVKQAVLDTIELAGDGVLLIFLAGHGTQASDGTYFVCADGDALEPGLDLAWLSSQLGRRPQGSTTIAMLDFCHSGALTMRGGRGFQRLTTERLSESVGGGNGRVLLAACSSEDVSFESPEAEHGVFTRWLLAGLMGGAISEDGSVTVPALFDFVSTQMESSGSSPVLQGYVEGQFSIGTGLQALWQGRALETTDRRFLLEVAQRVGNLRSLMATSFRDQTAWQREDFSRCCAQVGPTADFIDGLRRTRPSLATNDEFQAHSSWLDSQRRRLGGEVDRGVRLHGFEIQRSLGSGGFGRVWLAHRIDEPTTKVAVKVYHANELSLLDKVQRFRRGYEAMKRLNHPRIVTVQQELTCPLAFFMQYVEGGDLTNYAWRAKDEPAMMLRLLLVVAETLSHAHNHDVIHRDVKPGNVLVKESKQGLEPYLTDFDLAWISKHSQLTKDAMGVLQYAAPEQMAKPGSSAAHSPRVDIFSFGQLCFFALTQSDPVPSGQADNIVPLTQAISTWPGANSATRFLSLWKSMTAVNPQDRPGTFSEITEEFNRILDLMEEGVDVHHRLTEAEFVKQLDFALNGASDGEQLQTKSLRSPSGGTMIDLELLPDIGKSVVRLLLLELPKMPGCTTVQVRDHINRRLGDALAGCPGVRRRPGNQSPFETRLEIEGFERTFGGVRRLRDVLNIALTQLERSA